MANSPVVVIGFTFTDRDANTAKVTFYTDWTLAIGDVQALADYIESRLVSVSDAVLSRVEIVFRWRADDPPEAPETADLERKLLLLITNDAGEINGLIIPSPIDLFEPLGPFAGVRADLTNAAVLAFQDMLGEFEFRTADDRQLGQVIAAGGLAL